MEFDPDKLRKIVRIYRVAKGAGSVLEQKARLDDILQHQKRSMDTIIDIADGVTRTANADLTGEDVRKVAKVTLRHGSRVYAYVAKYIREHRDDE